MEKLHQLYLLFKIAEDALKYTQTRSLHNWAMMEVLRLQNEIMYPDDQHQAEVAEHATED